MQFQTVPENYVGFDLLVNRADSTTIVTIVFPILLKFEYTENTPAPVWTYVLEDTATVMGYHCHAAKCTYGGREWKVYYTNDIPFAIRYPWKLRAESKVALFLKQRILSIILCLRQKA